MNYETLPVSQRIQMASEYALLLIEDSVQQEDIIKTLQETFFLSQDEAIKAYQKTRAEHSSEVGQLQNASIYRIIASFLACIIGGAFYVFMGREAGVVFIVLGVIFLGAGLLGFIAVIQKLMDKFFYSPSLIKKRIEKAKDPKKEKQDWTVQLFLLALFFFAIAGFNCYSKAGWVDLRKLKTVTGVKLAEPLKKHGTGGKSPSYYYVFRFQNHSNEFRFYDRYYNYVPGGFDASSFNISDTFSILVTRSDYEQKLYYPGNDRRVDIINIMQTHPLIDLQKRNDKELSNNKMFFSITGFIALAALLVMLIRHKIAADKDQRNSINTYCLS
jgi:hypothetical protein